MKKKKSRNCKQKNIFEKTDGVNFEIDYFSMIQINAIRVRLAVQR